MFLLKKWKWYVIGGSFLYSIEKAQKKEIEKAQKKEIQKDLETTKKAIFEWCGVKEGKSIKYFQDV